MEIIWFHKSLRQNGGGTGTGFAVDDVEREETAMPGRFAPSPSGPLHLGLLVAALAGWLDARSGGGEWLVRLGDPDALRCLPRAGTSILKTLGIRGLEWDWEVVRQSESADSSGDALELVSREGRAFACGCTRREITDTATGKPIPGESPYSGTCHAGLIPGGKRARSSGERTLGSCNSRAGRRVRSRRTCFAW